MNEEFCRSIRPLIVALVIIMVIGAMRLTSVVTVPVALAVFIVIIAWPLQARLERKRLPRALCYICTLLAVLMVFGVFLGILYICAESVAAKAPEYEKRFSELFERFRVWAEANGNGEQENDQVAGGIVAAVQAAVKWAYGLLGLFVLTVTFFVLGLIEVHSFHDKITKHLSRGMSRKLLEAGEEMSVTLQRYMLARTIVSGTTGILVGLFTWAIGLDFALVWGVMAFLLNYIPILGSIVAVIPPTVIAFIQPEAGIWMGFATLGGLMLIQFTIGNYIDPQIEGKILSLSPVVLFFSIVFWGWVWSIPGALMGIPITACIVIFCRKYESSEWLANMLAKEKPGQ